MTGRPEDFTAQQRAALALWLLMQAPMATREIAEQCGLSMGATRYMLHNLAAVIPLRYDRREWWINGHKTSKG